MQRYGRKTSKMPHLLPSKTFFQKSGPVTFVSLWSLASCKKLENTNEQFLRYLKTDTRTDGHTDGQGRLLTIPSGKPKYHQNVIVNENCSIRIPKPWLIPWLIPSLASGTFYKCFIKISFLVFYYSANIKVQVCKNSTINSLIGS